MFILDIAIAGINEAKLVVTSEKIKIIIIEKGFTSLGISSKKYTSLGNISTLKMYDKITLIDSMFSENKTPIIIPKTLAISPIVKPVKKKDFIIELLLRPSVFKIAISLVLFLIKIVSPEIILKAATIMINVRIINITFLSTLRALKNDLFKSIQL